MPFAPRRFIPIVCLLALSLAACSAHDPLSDFAACADDPPVMDDPDDILAYNEEYYEVDANYENWLAEFYTSRNVCPAYEPQNICVDYTIHLVRRN
jgi:hypothetical protein